MLLALAACSQGFPLPVSTSTAEIPPPDVTLQVERSGVRVDGVRVGALDDQAAVIQALQDRADALKSAGTLDPGAPAFRGAASIEVDRNLPAVALRNAISAASTAGFSKPWVVVSTRAAGRAGIRLAPPTPAQVAAAAPSAEPAPTAGSGWANPTVTVHPDRGYVITAHDLVFADVGGLTLPCVAQPCGPGRYPAVELNRLMRRLKLDHPRDRAVIVTAGGTVQDLVNTFDATRDDGVAGRGTTELFPEILLAQEGEP
jgi:hypothetical protein